MRRLLTWLVPLVLVAVAIAAYIATRSPTGPEPLRVGIAPYQDLAMIVNAKPLGLESKYGTTLDLVTMNWEDIPPAVASAGRGVDVGFGGYVEYLTKYANLNADSTDPVLFIYPLYVFKGGAFVTFKPDVPILTKAILRDAKSAEVRKFLALRIGAQRGSIYQLMIFYLAKSHGIDPASLTVVDTPLDQGFLAAEQGSLDIAEAGLTQLTEAQRRGGHAVLDMESLGFADLTGFIVKKSVYEKRRKDVDNLIRMWFDCVNYVYADMDHNSADSLAYLNANASTRYTLSEYKAALQQEYLPRSLGEATAQLIATDGNYSADRIGRTANDYLLQQHVIKAPSPLPVFPKIE